jgi:hypothetical protein
MDPFPSLEKVGIGHLDCDILNIENCLHSEKKSSPNI